MIFNFKNLGTIKEADIELGNLTVICGKNNTGKTYLSYALWAVLSRHLTYTVINSNIFPTLNKIDIANQLNQGLTVKIDLKLLEEYIKEQLIGGVKAYSKQLDKVFSSNTDFFKKTNIHIWKDTILINYSKKIENTLHTGNSNGSIIINYIKEIDSSIIKFRKLRADTLVTEDTIESLFSFILSTLVYFPVFILTAQRDSIGLFYKALDRNNSDLISKLMERKNFDFLEKNIPRFAMPINVNMNFARDLTSQVVKNNSFLKEKHPELLNEIEIILDVNFTVINEAVLIKDNKTGVIVPDFMTSTSVRSLLHLHFWLKYQAQEGDLLMIDEPELNLHPENQIKLARLFVKLVNAGIKVWITTHSDYIIKEINNCLMLSGDFEGKQKLMKKYHYQKDEVLQKEDLRVYIAENHTVRKIEVDEYGMKESSFDDTLNYINNVSDDFTTAIYNQTKAPVNS